MLDLEVMPERGLGSGQWEFVLGMPLSQAAEILKRQCAVVKNVQISYNEQRPLDMDLVVDLTDDGIELVFDSKSQRLKSIKICDVSKVKLRYCNKHFCSPDVKPTVEQIHHSFGSTHPGQVDSKQQCFVLLFRGILFAFPFGNMADTGGFTGESPDLQDLDFQWSLELSRVCIFSGSDPKEASAPSLPLECFHGNWYGDSVEVVKEGEVIVGLKLQLMADDPHHSKPGDTRPRVFERIVRFGDSPQDVASALGSPSKLYFKAEDKMRIHSPSPHKFPTARCSDYFFNYFTLGLDVLFDCVTHRAKKFVLHTNFPGHYNFNIYHRCHFMITFPLDQELCRDSSLLSVTITPSTKWSEVQDYLTRPSDKPVVLNRSPSTNSINPFGCTYCYGYHNVIFEVMRNHHIASVTIYNLKSL